MVPTKCEVGEAGEVAYCCGYAACELAAPHVEFCDSAGGGGDGDVCPGVYLLSSCAPSFQRVGTIGAHVVIVYCRSCPVVLEGD